MATNGGFRLAITALTAAGALIALPSVAWADGATAGSLMSREAAIQEATQWMPPGATITSTNCTEMVIDSSSRYVCTVQWGPHQP